MLIGGVGPSLTMTSESRLQWIKCESKVLHGFHQSAFHKKHGEGKNTNLFAEPFNPTMHHSTALQKIPSQSESVSANISQERSVLIHPIHSIFLNPQPAMIRFASMRLLVSPAQRNNHPGRPARLSMGSESISFRVLGGGGRNGRAGIFFPGAGTGTGLELGTGPESNFSASGISFVSLTSGPKRAMRNSLSDMEFVRSITITSKWGARGSNRPTAGVWVVELILCSFLPQDSSISMKEEGLSSSQRMDKGGCASYRNFSRFMRLM